MQQRSSKKGFINMLTTVLVDKKFDIFSYIVGGEIFLNRFFAGIIPGFF